MKAGFDVSGFRDIDDALAALPQATSKAVVRRGLTKELKPVAEMANNLWPGASEDAFAVSTKLARGQAEVGLPTGAVVIYVGSTRGARQAHLLEWGTEPRYHESGKYVGAVAPSPSLTPAWDTYRGQILEGLAATLRQEIEATVARRAKRGL